MTIEFNITVIISNENESKEIIADCLNHAGSAVADYIKKFGAIDIGTTQHCINADTPILIDEISLTRTE